MWLLQLVLKAAIFFTLFAFALNNQHEAVVHFFFGTNWQAPLVLVVLLAFVMGVAVGVVGMVPRWWRQPVWRKRHCAMCPKKPLPRAW